jgi:hypothetical protein
MSAGMWAAIGTGLTLVLLVVKYVLSGDAVKAAIEAQFQKDEKARQDAQAAQLQANQAQASSVSAGAASAWDAADNEGNHP